MHVVAIYGWKDEVAELAQALSQALGLTLYEARQRLIGGGPAVVARFAEPQRAEALAAELEKGGVATLVLDADARSRVTGSFLVRRFELGESSLRLESTDGVGAEIAYREVAILISALRISGQNESRTVTERKFSLGRTVLSGGIPLTKTVTRQEEVATEERTRLLYLFAGQRPRVVFRQSGMSYDGLGAAMKMSQELNFSFLTSELRRLCPAAVLDERLANRSGQVRLLGPAQSFEGGLELAAEILGRALVR